MRLHCETVKLKNGTEKFRVRYWENGKNIVLKDHPFFKSFNEAKSWCLQQNEKIQAFKLITQNNSLNEIAFKNEVVGDWNTIVAEFLDWHKITAQNTHETAKSWLLNYIFPFFLNKRAKFGLWPEYFEEFKEHLMIVVSPKNGRVLSYSSRNHIIKYLNLFLTFLRTKKKQISAFDKCSYFAKSLVNSRGLESLINKEEQQYLMAIMDGNERLEFLYILLKTGLRLNELFSLQGACVDMDLSRLNPLILNPFEKMRMKTYGYIRLESQIKNPHPLNFRNDNGEIVRKPLKCRKKISPDNHRIIPIFDAKAWNILVKYRRRAFDDFKKRKYKSGDVNDYLLFNVPRQRMTQEISKFFKGKKSCHCARHTFTTELVSKFLEYNIGPEYIRHITGHGMEEWRRYTHIVLDEESEKRKQAFEYF